MSLNGSHHLQDQGTNPNQSQLIARFNVSLKKLVSYQEEGFYVQNESPWKNEKVNVFLVSFWYLVGSWSH